MKAIYSLSFRPMLQGLTFSLVVMAGLTVPVHAQGLIAFNNLANDNPSFSADTGGLVYLWNGSGSELLNQDINLQLSAGPTPDSLTLIATWLLSDGSAKGIATGGGHFADPSGATYAISGVSPGSLAIIRIEAWTGNYNNSEDSYIAGGLASGITFSNPTGGGGASAASLVNMPAIVLANLEIPEPASVVLLLAGAGALLAWHRKIV